jgi:transcriptional antiterminator RfaH
MSIFAADAPEVRGPTAHEGPAAHEEPGPTNEEECLSAAPSRAAGRASWYVIHCHPREEQRALEHLERQRYTCYFPTLMREHLRGRRRIEVREPLFPRYLFIRLDEVRSNWYPIRSTRGVQQLVCSNGHPLAVKDAIVEGIRERVENDTLHVPRFLPGERVRIVEGAFADMEAIFVASAGDERVVLLMNILHHDQQIKFPAQSVRKLA